MPGTAHTAPATESCHFPRLVSDRASADAPGSFTVDMHTAAAARRVAAVQFRKPADSDVVGNQQPAVEEIQRPDWKSFGGMMKGYSVREDVSG